MKLVEIGRLRHEITLHNPGTPVPDGEGGFTETMTLLTPPRVKAEITPATARDLERITSGTVLATASHVIRMRYHPGVTTETRITFNGRTFNVVGVQNIEERNRELEVIAVEVVP